MPKQAGDFDAVSKALVVGMPHFGAKAPKEADNDSTRDHVKRVQTGQREINGGISIMPGSVAFHGSDLSGVELQFRMLGGPALGRAEIVIVLSSFSNSGPVALAKSTT